MTPSYPGPCGWRRPRASGNRSSGTTRTRRGRERTGGWHRNCCRGLWATGTGGRGSRARNLPLWSCPTRPALEVVDGRSVVDRGGKLVGVAAEGNEVRGRTTEVSREAWRLGARPFLPDPRGRGPGTARGPGGRDPPQSAPAPTGLPRRHAGRAGAIDPGGRRAAA